MADEDLRTLEGLREAFRVFRHDTNNALARYEALFAATEDVPDSIDELRRALHVITGACTLAGMLDGPDSMSRREIATIPAQARSWIAHGEAADQREETTMHRARVLVTYATVAQGTMAVAAVIANYLINHH